ncbi:hypothetical protein V5799_008217 [Amblyomma americanum]|uniref:ABC-2 type transporter transmembrane domain-containing protein n=1 Tax=Amblyomma americanum TaxID=6943 RepID=A0AAQ4FDX0_AMBAM
MESASLALGYASVHGVLYTPTTDYSDELVRRAFASVDDPYVRLRKNAVEKGRRQLKGVQATNTSTELFKAAQRPDDFYIGKVDKFAVLEACEAASSSESRLPCILFQDASGGASLKYSLLSFVPDIEFIPEKFPLGRMPLMEQMFIDKKVLGDERNHANGICNAVLSNYPQLYHVFARQLPDPLPISEAVTYRNAFYVILTLAFSAPFVLRIHEVSSELATGLKPHAKRKRKKCRREQDAESSERKNYHGARFLRRPVSRRRQRFRNLPVWDRQFAVGLTLGAFWKGHFLCALTLAIVESVCVVCVMLTAEIGDTHRQYFDASEVGLVLVTFLAFSTSHTLLAFLVSAAVPLVMWSEMVGFLVFTLLPSWEGMDFLFDSLGSYLRTSRLSKLRLCFYPNIAATMAMKIIGVFKDFSDAGFKLHIGVDRNAFPFDKLLNAVEGSAPESFAEYYERGELTVSLETRELRAVREAVRALEEKASQLEITSVAVSVASMKDLYVRSIDIRLSAQFPGSTVFLQAGPSEFAGRFVSLLRQQGARVTVMKDAYHELRAMAQDKYDHYSTQIAFGGVFSGSEIELWYSPYSPISRAVGLNLITTTLNQVYSGNPGARILTTLRTYNKSRPRETWPTEFVPELTRNRLFWCLVPTVAFGFLVAAFALQPASERLSGARTLFLMTGVSRQLMVFADLAFDLFFYACPMTICLALYILFFEPGYTTTGALVLTIASFAPVAVLSSYAIAEFASRAQSAYVTCLTLFVIGDALCFKNNVESIFPDIKLRGNVSKNTLEYYADHKIIWSYWFEKMTVLEKNYVLEHIYMSDTISTQMIVVLVKTKEASFIIEDLNAGPAML